MDLVKVAERNGGSPMDWIVDAATDVIG